MYSFYATTANGIKRQVKPLATDGVKLVQEKEADTIFYRMKFSGSLTFVQDNFLFFHGLEEGGRRCEKIGLDITRTCGGEEKLFWSGTISLTDGKYDLKKCQVIFDTIATNDLYTCIIDNYEKEYNVLEVPPANLSISAKLDFNADFEFKRIEMGTLQNEDDSDTWASFLETSYYIDGKLTQHGTRSKTQIIYRMVTEEPYVDGEVAEIGNGWAVVADGIVRNGLTYAKYAKPPDLYNFTPYKYELQRHFTRYPSLIQVPCGQAYDKEKYIEVTGINGANSEECGGCLNMRKKVDETRCIRLLWEFGAFSFKRGRRLVDVLKFLVQKTCPAAVQENISMFFNTAELKDILIFAKSDIIGYNSTEVGSKEVISLKNMLDALRLQFQAYWYLDDNNKLAIEHLSFFSTVGEKDLTEGELLIRNNKAYEYDKASMPQYEILSYSEGLRDDFLRGEIEYTGACVSKQKTEYTVSNFNNDLYNLLTQGQSLDRRGFTFVVHDGQQVLIELGDVSGELLVNGRLSAANQVKYYYTDGRVLINGLVNGKLAIFNSTINIKMQAPITIPSCCALGIVQPLSKFTTLLSNSGRLKQAEYNLKTPTAKFVILHPVDDTGIVPVKARAFNDSHSPSFG